MRRSTICVMMILSALGVVGSAYADRVLDYMVTHPEHSSKAMT